MGMPEEYGIGLQGLPPVYNSPVIVLDIIMVPMGDKYFFTFQFQDFFLGIVGRPVVIARHQFERYAFISVLQLDAVFNITKSMSLFLSIAFTMLCVYPCESLKSNIFKSVTPPL